MKTVNREDPSQQSVLLVTKATTIAYKTQKVTYNSSVTSYIISNAFVCPWIRHCVIIYTYLFLVTVLMRPNKAETAVVQ